MQLIAKIVLLESFKRALERLRAKTVLRVATVPPPASPPPSAAVLVIVSTSATSAVKLRPLLSVQLTISALRAPHNPKLALPIMLVIVTATIFCEDGSACVDTLCAGLTSAISCGVDTCNTKFVESDCLSFFTAGYRYVGELGCDEGSMCATFHDIKANMYALYVLNLIDTILEFVALFYSLFSIAWQVKKKGSYQESSHLMLEFFMPLDLILQVAVLVVAFDPAFMEDLDSVESANCWSDFNSYVVWDGIKGDLKLIRVLGGLEAFLGVVSLGGALVEHTSDETTKHNVGLTFTFIAMLLDVIISVIDFFAFTMPAQSEIEELFDKMTSDSSDNCVRFSANQTTLPVMVTSFDNCLEPTIVVGHVGSIGWIICTSILTPIWAIVLMCFCVYKICNKNSNVSHD